MRTVYSSIICIASMLAAHTNSSSQTLDWAKQFGGPESDEGIGIAIGGHGNVYSAGNFNDTSDFDPGPGTFNLASAGDRDIFISKLDSAGNFLWAKQIGGVDWETCNAIAADDSGNVYVTGTFLGTTDFDPGPGTFNLTSSPSTDAFICKLDASGNFVWVKRFGGGTSSAQPQPVSCNSITLDDSGNVYTTGIFDGPTDFDPGAGTFTLTPGLVFSSDIFISKLNASGGFVWAKQLGGTAFEGGYAIDVDGIGNVYTTGFFNGTVDFDPGAGTFNLSAPAGETVIFISKLDSTGNFAWAKQVGGQTGFSIAADHSGDVYVSGDYLNDSITITKFDASGNSIWAKQIGADIGYSMVVDGNNDLYITGQFHGTKDFDPGAGSFNLTAIGSSDAYISKLDPAGNLIWAKQLGGTNDVVGRSLALDDNDNVYTVGNFSETADFDPGTTAFDLTSLGGLDIFIHKMKPATLGLEEVIHPDAFKVYPNPGNGKFTVELESKYNGAELILRNMMGQVITKRTVNNNRLVELEITGADGLYILELNNKNGLREVARIIKN